VYDKQKPNLSCHLIAPYRIAHPPHITMQATPRTTFFSLPTELRLQIAEYALEQRGDVALRESRELRIDPTYNAAFNMSLILVCRQFQRDFTGIAYQMTRFVFVGPKMQLVHGSSDAKLRNLRKVVVDADWSQIDTWQAYPFNKECLMLEELCVVALPNEYGIVPLVSLLERLRNVKKLRFFPCSGNHRLIYGRLVGAMYKYDHYRRYDAPDAPNLEHVWWEHSFNVRDSSVDLVTCQPEPPMAEEDYMVMMKPKIHELIEWESNWSAIGAIGN
jgi:hypothetical protein